MIEPYWDAAIQQGRARARLLKAKVPHPVKAAELVALQQLCERRIDDIIDQFDYLLTDQTILLKELMKERIRMFRRTLGELSQIETTAIAALSRVHDDDIFLNKLVFQIHSEVGYPLSPPTVTCLSREYFSINPALHLLEVPLAESDFLLHLPDLYHEIAHPLIATTNNPKVEPFQTEFGKFLIAETQHFEAERVTNVRRTGPAEYFGQVLDLFERFWTHWASELFCDLFAIYTLGPAYAWSHLHLTAGHEGDPFDVRLNRFMSHPPDEARMETMLIGLDLIGFRQGAQEIRRKWDAFLKSTGSVQTPLYRKACPVHLLEQAAIHALEGTKQIGCRVINEATASPVHNLLNSAWSNFWANPSHYHAWERDAIMAFKRQDAPVASNGRQT